MPLYALSTRPHNKSYFINKPLLGLALDSHIFINQVLGLGFGRKNRIYKKKDDIEKIKRHRGGKKYGKRGKFIQLA